MRGRGGGGSGRSEKVAVVPDVRTRAGGGGGIAHLPTLPRFYQPLTTSSGGSGCDRRCWQRL